MKISGIIILSIAVAFLMIGVHQTFYYGLAQSYWIFMLVSGLYLFHVWQKKKKN